LFFLSVSEGGKGPCFCCVFAPFPEKGILDFIAHRPIIQVFTVLSVDKINRGSTKVKDSGHDTNPNIMKIRKTN